MFFLYTISQNGGVSYDISREHLFAMNLIEGSMVYLAISFVQDKSPAVRLYSEGKISHSSGRINSTKSIQLYDIGSLIIR
jgi:hypothetical protein